MILLDLLELLDSGTKIVLHSDDELLICENGFNSVPDKYRYCPVTYIGVVDEMLDIVIEV